MYNAANNTQLGAAAVSTLSGALNSLVDTSKTFKSTKYGVNSAPALYYDGLNVNIRNAAGTTVWPK
jgi:hypothetical protein